MNPSIHDTMSRLKQQQRDIELVLTEVTALRHNISATENKLDEVRCERDLAQAFQSKVMELLRSAARNPAKVNMNPLAYLETLVEFYINATPWFDGVKEPAPLCDKAPPGWRCTRDRGHEGPCAAHSKLCIDPAAFA